MASRDVLVIGAGVSGLTTALCLRRAGFGVRIVAARPPFATTSAVAGASWGPYMVSDPRVLGWSEHSRARLEEIATIAGTGVRMVDGLETAQHAGEPPDWAVEAPGFRRCRPEEVPAGYESGWRYTIPLIDMVSYLGYLIGQLSDVGVHVHVRTVASFADVAGTAGLIVNCAGLGARDLVPDPAVFPTRGQLVVVRNPGVDWFFQDNTDGEDLTYFLPHGDHVVLGGNAIEHATDLVPNPDTARAIVARCAAIEPKLGRATKIADRVGLRPTRGEVRVERVDVDGIPVIHNYGHGGSGVTLSWGCAREVCRLAA